MSIEPSANVLQDTKAVPMLNASPMSVSLTQNAQQLSLAAMKNVLILVIVLQMLFARLEITGVFAHVSPITEETPTLQAVNQVRLD